MARQILIPIIALTVVSLFLVQLQQQAEASRDGFEDGKDAGRDDWNAGKSFDDNCYDDFLYCLRNGSTILNL